jgi:hypothetical protein
MFFLRIVFFILISFPCNAHFASSENHLDNSSPSSTPKLSEKNYKNKAQPPRISRGTNSRQEKIALLFSPLSAFGVSDFALGKPKTGLIKLAISALLLTLTLTLQSRNEHPTNYEIITAGLDYTCVQSHRYKKILSLGLLSEFEHSRGTLYVISKINPNKSSVKTGKNNVDVSIETYINFKAILGTWMICNLIYTIGNYTIRSIKQKKFL